MGAREVLEQVTRRLEPQRRGRLLRPFRELDALAEPRRLRRAAQRRAQLVGGEIVQ
jgi:hypothetical protein